MHSQAATAARATWGFTSVCTVRMRIN